MSGKNTVALTLDKQEQQAKEFCNRLRKKCGLRAVGKLKKGIPQHPRMCPIALTLLDCGVDAASPGASPDTTVALYSKDGKRRVYDEPQVAQFMREFDRGKYPHLEMPKTVPTMKHPGERKQRPIL